MHSLPHPPYQYNHDNKSVQPEQSFLFSNAASNHNLLSPTPSPVTLSEAPRTIQSYGHQDPSYDHQDAMQSVLAWWGQELMPGLPSLSDTVNTEIPQHSPHAQALAQYAGDIPQLNSFITRASGSILAKYVRLMLLVFLILTILNTQGRGN